MLLKVAMVFKIISMFVHPSRKVSTDLSYTLEEDVFEKYLIHGFVFTDLGITHHNFHKVYKVSRKNFFVSVLIYFQIDPG